MKKYDLEELFKHNPELLHKKMDRYTIRSLLNTLSNSELGELISDCGTEFIQMTRNHLAIHLEKILSLLRRN
jgi:hypothetical protein